MRKRPDPASRWTVPDNPAMHWTDLPSPPSTSPPRSVPAADKTGPDARTETSGPAPQLRHDAAKTPLERLSTASPVAAPPPAPRAVSVMPASSRRTGRKTKLTPEIHQRIVAYIRAGAFDWVAAQACGIVSSTFYLWLQQGDAGDPQFLEFSEDVRRARAASRLAAEVEFRKDDPQFWLRCGPGKDRPGEPGWTDRPATIEMPHVTIIVTDRWRV